MPMQRQRYPPEWHTISRRIRFERAANRCEWCGVTNRTWVLRQGSAITQIWTHGVRYRNGEIFVWNEDPNGEQISETEGYTIVRPPYPVEIILTVAHLGVPFPDGQPGDKHNKHDVREENLASLCQKCHLAYDLRDHICHAAQTRRQKRITAGQQELPFVLEREESDENAPECD